MLIQTISAIGVIIGIILGGAKLGSSIKELELKVFFWILYGVSVFTLILVVICFYIFFIFRKKNGPLGPRGFQGEPGDLGDPGTCDQNLCRGRNLAIMMEKIIEKHNKKSVSTDIKKHICGFINTRDVGVDDINNSDVLKYWDLTDVKIFRDIFSQEVAKEEEIDTDKFENIIDETLKKWNVNIADKDDAKKLKDFKTECE